jgi:hypothetical protein
MAVKGCSLNLQISTFGIFDSNIFPGQFYTPEEYRIYSFEHKHDKNKGRISLLECHCCFKLIAYISQNHNCFCTISNHNHSSISRSVTSRNDCSELENIISNIDFQSGLFVRCLKRPRDSTFLPIIFKVKNEQDHLSNLESLGKLSLEPQVLQHSILNNESVVKHSEFTSLQLCATNIHTTDL